jgi:hypothetical protein
MALQEAHMHTCRKIRIDPIGKSSGYNGTPSDPISFVFPSAGVVDLDSVCLRLDMAFSNTASSGTVVDVYGAQLISRLETLIGQQPIGLAACTDYGYSWTWHKHMAEPSWSDTCANKVYELTKYVQNSTVTTLVNDWRIGLIGGRKNIRFLPMQAINELMMRIVLDVPSRLPGFPSGGSVSIKPTLYCTMYDFNNGFLDSILLSRLREPGGSLSIGFLNATNGISTPYTQSTQHTVLINAQSVDLVAAASQNTATGAITNRTFYDTQAGTDKTKSSWQLYVNSVPMTSYAMDTCEAWISLVDAIDGTSGNYLAEPKYKSLADFTDFRFMFVNRFCLPVSGDEKLISGLSTVGMNAPLVIHHTDASATPDSKQLRYCIYHTSTAELYLGKAMTYVP